MDLVTDLNQMDNINVYAFGSRTISDEMDYANARLIPLLTLSGVLMVIFVTVTVSRRDWVRGKIVVGLTGILSVVMATSSAFGILSYLHVPFVGINYATVFLMLG